MRLCGQPFTRRVSTSVKYRCGLTPFSLHVSTSEAMQAQRSPPSSPEANNAFFRLKTKYGPELADVVETGSRARGELDLLEGASFELEELQRREREAGPAEVPQRSMHTMQPTAAEAVQHARPDRLHVAFPSVRAHLPCRYDRQLGLGGRASC